MLPTKWTSIYPKLKSWDSTMMSTEACVQPFATEAYSIWCTVLSGFIATFRLGLCQFVRLVATFLLIYVDTLKLNGLIILN